MAGRSLALILEDWMTRESRENASAARLLDWATAEARKRAGQGARVESASNADIKRLRKEAGRLGIAIRMQPVSRASPSRVYRLIERDTGRVIYKDAALHDIRTRLWMMRYRQRAPIASVRAHEPTLNQCPSCGTMRIASFRWCPSCGFDYQAAIEPSPDPGRSPASIHASSRPRWAPALYPALYLVGIAGAEAAARGSYTSLALLVYAVILVAGLNQAAASSSPEQTLLLTVALVAAVRVLGLIEPLASLVPSFTSVAIAVPTLVGIALVVRVARYSRRELGLFIDRRVAWISLALTLPSAALGFVISNLVQPVALDSERSIAGIVASASVLALTTGLIEEMLFRGLIQRAAANCLGPLPGLLYVSVLYTVLASATWNAVGIAVVFTIALALAAVTTYTRSVVPAAAAHASLNVGVLLATASVVAGVGLR
jgi:uncharacterized protein